MRIVLIGAPGSGKGTQAKLLAERYRIPHISTGDLLRNAISTDTSFSEKYKDLLESGQLVPDEAVRELLEERLRRKDTKRGFVVDGYPRNIPQAQELDNLLGMMGRPLQIGIYTEVDNETLVKRITGRLNCPECGAIYNKHFSPPKKATKCDNCGSKLETRKDDNVKTVTARVEVYNQNTVPLITYYRAQHKLRTVAAIDSVDVIHAKICAIVDLEIRPLEMDEVFAATDTVEEEESTIIAGGLINKVEPDLEAIARKEAQIVKRAEQRAEQKAAEAETKKTATKTKASKKATAKKSLKTKTEAKVEKTPAKVAKKKAVTKKKASKPTTTKTTKKKAVSKKATAKKVTTKSAPKKAAVKKKVAKKVAAKKGAAKKAVAKKPLTKKVAKKVTKKKTVTKKKATIKKSAPKKAAAKKKVAKKIAKKVTKKVTKKSAPKKGTSKKAPAKKTIKKVVKKTAAKKSSTKKVAKKKTTAKKKKK